MQMGQPLCERTRCMKCLLSAGTYWLPHKTSDFCAEKSYSDKTFAFSAPVLKFHWTLFEDSKMHQQL